MEKRALLLLNITLMAVLLLSQQAFAAWVGNGRTASQTHHQIYACNKCHNATFKFGTASFNNVCLTCHNPSPTALAKDTPFSEADAANLYGTIINGYSSATPSKIYRTSHGWSGPATNSQAGTGNPTSGALAGNANIANKLLCMTCHNIHGPYSSATTGKPFLRMRNDNDELCLDCHRNRDTSNHALGTHPLKVDLQAASLANPGKYNYPPINANPGNPTANMVFRNGKILCSTCHRTHYADSKSSTVDSPATWAVISASNGSILRTDLKTESSNGRNICLNCHTGMSNHDGSGQNVQCSNCHSGHVDYDPADPTFTQTGKPNVYLIKRVQNFSSATGKVVNQRVLYRYTSAALKMSEMYKPPGAGDSTTGLCSTCHKPATTCYNGGNTASPKDCNLCHAHGTEGGSFTAGCTYCHGQPPMQNTPRGPGFALYSVTGQPKSFYTSAANWVNEANTPHISHAGTDSNARYGYGCVECHQGNTHSSKTFQDVFINKAGIKAGVLARYSGAAIKSCNGMYCHSNGRGGFKRMLWTNTKGQLFNTVGSYRCQVCHPNTQTGMQNDADPTNSGKTHSKHLQKILIGTTTYSCQHCHNNVSRSYTSLHLEAGYASMAAKSHVNGLKTVAMNFNQTPTLAGKLGTISNASGMMTCSTVYCHSNGRSSGIQYATTTWTNSATGTCGTCHPGTYQAMGNPNATNTTIVHFTHLSAAWGPKIGKRGSPLDCQTCHTYTNSLAATHVDGAIQVTNGVGSVCKNCHPNGTLPAWTNTARISCFSCHDGASLSTNYTGKVATRVYSSAFRRIGHGKYTTVGGRPGLNNCAVCHTINDRAHFGGTSDPRLVQPLLSSAAGNRNNQCNACHNSAATYATYRATNREVNQFSYYTSNRDMLSHVYTKGGAGSMACHDCHSPHGTTNIHLIKTLINGRTIVLNNLTSGWVNDNETGLCQVCHTGTNHYRNYSTAYTGGYSTHYKKNCMSCHSHKTAGARAAFLFGGGGGGSCDGCHGYPPAPGTYKYFPANDAHQKHTGLSKDVGDGYTGNGTGMSCATCHDESLAGGHPGNAIGGASVLQTNIHIKMPNSYRFNNLSTVRYKGLMTGNSSGSCSNASCHIKPTPKWRVDE